MFRRLLAAGGATRPMYLDLPPASHQAALGTVPRERTPSRASQPRTRVSSQQSQAASAPSELPAEEKKSADIIVRNAARSRFFTAARKVVKKGLRPLSGKFVIRKCGRRDQ